MAMNGASRPPPKTRRLPDGRAKPIAPGKAEVGGDDLLTVQELATWFGTARGILDNARMRGDGPPFVQISPGVIRYHRASVLDWLMQRQMTSTKDPRHQYHPTGAGRMRGARVVDGKVIPPETTRKERIVLKRPT